MHSTTARSAMLLGRGRLEMQFTQHTFYASMLTDFFCLLVVIRGVNGYAIYSTGSRGVSGTP
ncbi:hypothetical protein PTR25_11905 [Serratia nevei]|uniref:hypothetical protein n=1 Tax=Serratia nevei TaxID=2703794 RepID=UPI00313C644A